MNDSSLRVRTARTYDPVGRVSTITSYKTLEDSGTNATTVTFGYDSFSRRTSLQDPDSGTWAYNYDAAGNLIYQDDPKTSQHLEFCYDNLNRLKCRYGYTASDTWSGGNSCPASSSTSACPSIANATILADYTYDTYVSPLNSNFTCGSGKERPCRIGDASGWTSFSYDARGRVLGSEKTISAAGFTKTFTYARAYDQADHLIATVYPTDVSTELLQMGYDAGGQPYSAYTPGQDYVTTATYDRFGRITGQLSGSEFLLTTWTYFDGNPDGPANQFRLKEILVGNSNTYQKFDYGPYDRVGNLESVSDDSATYPAANTYAHGSPRDAGWSYQYDGLGRLNTMTPQATSTWATSGSFTYDLIGNMTARSGLALSPDSLKPHHVAYSTPPGTTPTYQYDTDGGLTSRPDTDSSGPDTGWTIAYDVEGHVQSATVAGSPNKTVQSVYDFSGARVARIVTSGASSVPTFYFGRSLEVTGNQLTRHFYLVNRRIAQSTVTLPSGSPLILARAEPENDAIQIARTTLGHIVHQPLLYPRYVLARTGAVKLLAILLVLLVVFDLTPGRVRLGLAASRSAVFRRLRRGHVIVITMLFSLSLTPLVCVQPVRATGGGGPTFPAYFVHSDHLGSTTLLTCYNRPAGENCANGTPAAYFRYDAYGTMKAFDTSGNTVAAGSEKTDLLYTGQRWGAAERLYYYGARFYDPRIAAFLTQDPVRQDVNLYAYVGWNPINRIDPTGMDWADDIGLSKGFGDPSLSFYGSADIGTQQLADNRNLVQMLGGLGETGGPQGSQGSQGPQGGNGLTPEQAAQEEGSLDPKLSWAPGPDPRTAQVEAGEPGLNGSTSTIMMDAATAMGEMQRMSDQYDPWTQMTKLGSATRQTAAFFPEGVQVSAGALWDVYRFQAIVAPYDGGDVGLGRFLPPPVSATRVEPFTLTGTGLSNFGDVMPPPTLYLPGPTGYVVPMEIPPR